MKILAVSDEVVPWIYNPQLRDKCDEVDIVISCGDLPVDYLEFIASSLNKPSFFVHGNHDAKSAETGKGEPQGWTNLDLKRLRLGDLRLTGLEGCHRYKPGVPYQYSQSDQWLRAFWLGRQMAQGMARWGRGADIMVTHSPLRGIHDGEDLAHNGFEAFNWLSRAFRPRLWLHGHQHRNYSPLQAGETHFGDTLIVNVHPYRILDL